MTKFQIIVLAICVVCIVGGAIAFATFRGGANSSTTLPEVSIWGTLPASDINSYVQQINLTRSPQLQVNYTQYTQSNFNAAFINALASGTGPDIVLLPADMLSGYSGKIVPIPYTVLSQRDFMNTYVDGAQIYLGSQGVNAVPLLIDPMVMYWNRDLFYSAGLAGYPQYWSSFPTLVSKLTQVDSNKNVLQSAVSLGEFANVPHARELFATLLLQLGNPITVITSNGLSSALGNSNAYQGLSATTEAVNFFTEFADPTSPDYSWNRSLPSADTDFLSGKLAVYFGFASEINQLRNQNPNLNFDAAPMPQIQGSATKAVFAEIYGLSIARSSTNPNNAYAVIQALTDPSNLSTLVSQTYLPPARRDMIAAGTSDPYLTIFYNEALIAQSWDDTDPAQSSVLFQGMIESVVSGAQSVSNAIQSASNQYTTELQSQ